MYKLPQVRSESIVVQNLDSEVLIYFLETNQAICLNSTSALVYSHCDGKTTFDELKSKYQLTDDLIYLTLDKLNENNILKEYQPNKHFDGLSRREVIRRIGLSSMIALPIISSVVAPTATHAASRGTQTNNTTCTQNSDCASGFCTPTESALGVSSGRQCCYAANAPGAPVLGSTGRVRSLSTSEGSCNGSIQRATCCSNATTFSAPGSGAPGVCTCA